MKVVKLENISYSYNEHRRHMELSKLNEYVILDLVKSVVSVSSLELEMFNFYYYPTYGKHTPITSTITSELLTQYNIHSSVFNFYYYDIKFIEDRNNIRIGFLSEKEAIDSLELLLVELTNHKRESI